MAACKDSRGFRIYTQFRDQMGTGITVKESSVAYPHCVWIFAQKRDGKDFSPHLTVGQARRLIRALERFIKETA